MLNQAGQVVCLHVSPSGQKIKHCANDLTTQSSSSSVAAVYHRCQGPSFVTTAAECPHLCVHQRALPSGALTAALCISTAQTAGTECSISRCLAKTAETRAASLVLSRPPQLLHMSTVDTLVFAQSLLPLSVQSHTETCVGPRAHYRRGRYPTFHIIIARPSKQTRMVGSTLGVYSFGLILFLQEQIIDIIITSSSLRLYVGRCLGPRQTKGARRPKQRRGLLGCSCPRGNPACAVFAWANPAFVVFAQATPTFAWATPTASVAKRSAGVLPCGPAPRCPVLDGVDAQTPVTVGAPPSSDVTFDVCFHLYEKSRNVLVNGRSVVVHRPKTLLGG